MFYYFLSNCLSAQWAVLMAGSRGYNNYRHQADVFNLYHILTQRGFPKDHIITLAYDDIADHAINPFKGQVFSTADHHNVYPGHEAIDYTGTSATAENFLRVLMGDNRRGRALQSNSDDEIFVYYNDHGAPGFLCVPSNNGPELYADQLSATFNHMYKNKQFKNVFFVIEACYSGSVGYNITTPGVFVTVAAGPQQSSYSADWDSEIDAFRTNEFSKQFTNYVLAHPYDQVIDFVNSVAVSTLRSHVCAFGDFKVGGKKLSDFLLGADPIVAKNDDQSAESAANTHKLEANGGIDTRVKNAFVTFLAKKMEHSTGEERERLSKALDYEINRRKTATQKFKQIAHNLVSNGDEMNSDIDPNDLTFECYRTAVEGFRMFCGEVDEHELPKLKIFGHLCQKVTKEQLLSEIRESCPHKLWKNEDFYV